MVVLSSLFSLGILVLLVVVLVAMYNSLVSLRDQVRNSWARIDVQWKRRHDLIPNLVETVKGYAGHEKEALENVTRARAQAVSAEGVGPQSQAEKMLTAALGRLMFVVEPYPDLKANPNFLSLQEELTSTENKIGLARQAYNDTVIRFNTKIQSVPTNIVAGMLNFTEEEFFELQDEAAREAPNASNASAPH